MAESVVLEEEIDQNYEPTQEEIIEYATWLGMVRSTDGRRNSFGRVSRECADLCVFVHACVRACGRIWRRTRSCSGWHGRA